MKDLYDDIDDSNLNAYVDEEPNAYINKELKDIAESAKSIYAVDLDSFNQKHKKKTQHPMFQGATQNELKRGIIFSEILGKPKGF